jgi:hypothetical protein
MQRSYVHCVPSRTRKTEGTEGNNNAKRYVLIFRNGKEVMVKNDTGHQTDGTPAKIRELIFGTHAMLTEGCLYKRIDMMLGGSHW